MGDRGKASGRPAHMYRYSDQSTHAASELQNWVGSTLVPSLLAFVKGAATQQEGVNIDIGAVLARVPGMEHDLPEQIAQAYYTDREARTVGLAFQIAGGGGALTAPLTTTVRTTDSRIGALTAQYDAGAAAASRLPWPPAEWGDGVSNPADFYSDIFKLLEQNADNPEFCQGLLQAGGMDAVQKLLRSLTDGQFQGNITDGTLASDILTKILRNGFADPNIGAALGPSLPTLVPAVLKAIPVGHTATEVWRALLPQITTIASELPDPAVVRDLTHNVGAAIPKSLSAADLKKLMPELTALLSVGLTHSLPGRVPTTGPRHGVLNWAKDYGSQTGQVMLPYLQAIKAADMSTNERNALIKSLVQGAYLNVAFLPLGAPEVEGAVALNAFTGTVSSAALGALQSWVGSVDPTNTMGLGSLLKDTHPNKDVVTLMNIGTRAGETAIIASLLAQGRIYQPDRHTLVPLEHDPAAAARQVADLAQNPQNYEIRGVPGEDWQRLDGLLPNATSNAQQPGINKVLGDD
ncbi:hypothetical protein [Streptomyces sp. C184]|uniref:hypothetical protein n=1 Tax=Streptomyces sp. C184 TaxID=3237121 RepID=UPI0034C634C3